MMRAHPAAGLFPMLPDAELQALSADIAAHGLRQPIITIEEDRELMVLDGRNRYRACAMANVEPTFVAFAGEDPFAMVVSANLHRRHMSTSQRAMVADEIARLKQGIRKPHMPIGTCDATRDEAARMMRVSSRHIARARRVKEKGAPELAAAVVAGTVTVTAAAIVAKLPHEEQRDLLAAGPPAIVARANRRVPPPRIFLHNGSAAKEVKAGVVRVRPVVADDQSAPKSSGRPRLDDQHETVRSLTEQGFTTTDIAQRTGLAKRFIIHARSLIRKPTNVLAGITQDVSVFAESLESRASNFDARWGTSQEEEKEALKVALRACRTAATKLINRLNKEANGERIETRVCEDQAQ